jgi:MFS family permease
VQSLTADYYHSSARGQAFGTLWLTISVGGMLGALYATNTAAHDPFGIEGWRFVFFSVAAVRWAGGCVMCAPGTVPTSMAGLCALLGATKGSPS